METFVNFINHFTNCGNSKEQHSAHAVVYLHINIKFMKKFKTFRIMSLIVHDYEIVKGKAMKININL